MAPESTASQTLMLTSAHWMTTRASAMKITAEPMVPMRSACPGSRDAKARTRAIPMREQTRPVEARARGRNMRAGRSPRGSIASMTIVDAIAMEAIIEPQ